jgi:membrane protein implicated in regulation of membrane protease activity
MNMKQYYQDRFRWIFTYRKKGFLYGLAKTLCLVVGLPCYLVSFVVEMALTLVNALFCWIPLLNVAVQVVCKVIVTIVNVPFYWCVLPDIGAYSEWEKAQQQAAEQQDEALQVQVVEEEVLPNQDGADE